MIRLSHNEKPPIHLNFHVKSRDFIRPDILLPIETIHALNKAAEHLSLTTLGRYEIILTRGYVHWGPFKRLCGIIGGFIFRLLYREKPYDIDLLFSSNGHEDGMSVDVQLYDVQTKKILKFLSWRNIMIPRTKAERLVKTNNLSLNVLHQAMEAAGFQSHSDPREKLQIHYRLVGR